METNHTSTPVNQGAHRMKATHYNSSSKGPTLIATMNFRHATNSLRVLKQEADPDRADEVEGLEARLVELAAEYKALEAKYPTATPERRAEINAELNRLAGEQGA